MKIALIGYGKMGRMIEEIAISRGHEIVSIIDIDNQDEFSSPAFASADVAIEFTTPWTAYENYLKAWAAGVKVVSGSTGWMKEHEAEVRKACSDEGKTLFWASNFSVGVAIFSAVNKYLAKIMNGFEQYDVNLVETHHIHKIDAPSAQPSRWQSRLWRTSTASSVGDFTRQNLRCSASMTSARKRCQAFTPLLTTLPRT